MVEVNLENPSAGDGRALGIALAVTAGALVVGGVTVPWGAATPHPIRTRARLIWTTHKTLRRPSPFLLSRIRVSEDRPGEARELADRGPEAFPD